MGQVPTRIIVARRTLTALAFAALLLALFSAPALAGTFTVKNTKSGGPGSLRSAIQNANDNNNAPNVDTIEFDIPAPVGSIVPTSPLPAITEPVTIDGYTQPGASPNTSTEGNNEVLKIRINGANAGRRANGLKITADDTTIKGLVINRFKRSGIVLGDVTGNSIEGNYVGTDQTGVKDHANRKAGVRVVDGADNSIGGTGPGQPNLISWNRGGGVRVEGSSAIGSSVLSNRIYNNRGLGIDLGADGVTPNDPGDGDTGPNDLQNFPVIESAEMNNDGLTTIGGTLESTPGETFTIQCFAAGEDDASGHGEGRSLLDQVDATTDTNGDADFTCASSVSDTVQTVSATATSTTGDTSEFSENVTVR